VSPIRRFVFWVLLFAVPIQALAAPGWLCANAVHHPDASYQHVHGLADASDLEMLVGGSASHSHDTAALSDQADPEPSTPGLPGVGKCSACTGCCSAAFVVPTLAVTTALAKSVHEVAAYVSPAIAELAGDGPFRPPRTLTL
jgi:hypothetical protein